MNPADAIEPGDWPDVIHQALLEALQDVFGADAFERSRFGVRTDEETVALLSFHGAELQGHIGLAASTPFLTQWHPLPHLLQEAGEDECSDWLGELTNRIVGRLRARFGNRGIEIEVGTPTVLRGTSVTVRPKNDRLIATYETKRAPVAYLWTQLRISPSNMNAPRSTARHAGQGEVIRF